MRSGGYLRQVDPGDRSSLLLDRWALHGETIIDIANYLRIACLFLGLVVAAFYMRASFGYGVADRLRRVPGFSARTITIALLVIASCLTEFDRLDDPVTILLPINFTALLLGVYGLAKTPLKERAHHDEWLDHHDSPGGYSQ